MEVSGCAQLVGDVGHEIALGAFHLLDQRDVVKYGHSPAARHGRDVHLKDATRKHRGRTAHRYHAVFEHGADTLQYVRIANGLDQGMSDADGA